jgi:hypothetical protein
MSEELRPIPLRSRKELSDFLETIDTMTVVDIVYAVRGRTDRVVGFYYGVHDGAVYVAPHQQVGRHEEPFIEVPVRSICRVASCYAGTPYEAAFNMPRQPKPPQRRRGAINLKSEFL